jgi:hypothetical protein
MSHPSRWIKSEEDALLTIRANLKDLLSHQTPFPEGFCVWMFKNY